MATSTSTSKKTPKSPTFKKLPFLKGRVFELILCIVALGIMVAFMLQVPFSADGYDNRVTTALFGVSITMGLAVAILLRHDTLRLARYQREHDVKPGRMDPVSASPENAFFYRWLFIWFLPFATFLVIVPWIIAGVFEADDMSVVAITLIMFFMPWFMALLGVLFAAIVIYPIEMTFRGLIRYVRSGGKQGAQFYVGLYFMLILAIIVTGSMSFHATLPGKFAGAQIIPALLGVGDPRYITSEPLLWVTRVLVALAILIPVILRQVAKRLDTQDAQQTEEKKK